MTCCKPIRVEMLYGMTYLGAIAVDFGGQQVMTREGNPYQNGRPVYRSPDTGGGNYFEVASNGTNWIATRYVSGSPTAPQVGPHPNQQPVGTFGALTIYVP